MNRPIFEIVTTTAGAVSIRNNIVNEIMHNPVGPWIEANALYIEQSDLPRRLGENQQDEFVIFDVGLGAAANALAALHCIREAQAKGACRPVRLVSFEIDLELLRFALKHAHEFAHFKGYEKKSKPCSRLRVMRSRDLFGNYARAIFSNSSSKNRTRRI